MVLKSLFEEQINYEAGRLLYEQNYPEAEDYVKNYTKSNSVDGYLTLIEEAKKNVSIPEEVSQKFVSCLENAGVFKNDTLGEMFFNRFVQALKDA